LAEEKEEAREGARSRAAPAWLLDRGQIKEALIRLSIERSVHCPFLVEGQMTVLMPRFETADTLSEVAMKLALSFEVQITPL